MKRKVEILPLEITVTPNKEGIQRIEIFSKGDDIDNVFCLNKKTGFSVGGFYKVIGTAYHVFDDGSRILVYLIFNDIGVLLERATKYFEIVLDPRKQQ